MAQAKESDNANIIDTIVNAPDAPTRGSPEFREKVTEATNNMRKLLPELKNESQTAIIDHVQASNRPVDGNGQYVSNFVAIDDIALSVLPPALERIKGNNID